MTVGRTFGNRKIFCHECGSGCMAGSAVAWLQHRTVRRDRVGTVAGGCCGQASEHQLI